MRFQNKVAIVTGSGQGIGETYAKRLAAEGAAVVIAELNETGGQRVAGEIVASGGKAVFIKTDVSNYASCEALATATNRAFGGLDYLINNAAIFATMRHGLLIDIDLDYYRKFMEVNMHGAFYVTRAVLPLLEARGGGAVVNQSSAAAWLSGMSGNDYGISKLATNGFTTSLAVELGPRNIRVNGIAPGPTMTEALTKVPKDVLDGIVANLPLGRLGSTDDIANACLFLLSEEACWITGQTLCVDGGMIRRP